MDIKKITALLDRYLDGTATPSEVDMVETWYVERLRAGGEFFDAAVDPEIGIRLKARISSKMRRRGRLDNRWLAAACVALVAAGVWLLFRPADDTAIAPPVMLGSSEGSRLIHTSRGGYRQLSTPAGGQYRAVLPDGSTVWLNCASTLRYPVVFGARERRVELSGEGWFDIASDAGRPFVVVSGGVETVALGTSFDIMAYTDEAHLQATLLSGKIRCSDVVLGKPGEQLVVGGSGICLTDTAAATAWKTGRFEFDEQPMPVIMRQIQRWYPIRVDYTSGADTILLSGSIARRRAVRGLLELLSQTSKVHFDIDGDHVLVRP